MQYAWMRMRTRTFWGVRKLNRYRDFGGDSWVDEEWNWKVFGARSIEAVAEIWFMLFLFFSVWQCWLSVGNHHFFFQSGAFIALTLWVWDDQHSHQILNIFYVHKYLNIVWWWGKFQSSLVSKKGTQKYQKKKKAGAFPTSSVVHVRTSVFVLSCRESLPNCKDGTSQHQTAESWWAISNSWEHIRKYSSPHAPLLFLLPRPLTNFHF